MGRILLEILFLSSFQTVSLDTVLLLIIEIISANAVCKINYLSVQILCNNIPTHSIFFCKSDFDFYERFHVISQIIYGNRMLCSSYISSKWWWWLPCCSYQVVMVTCDVNCCQRLNSDHFLSIYTQKTRAIKL